MKKENLGPLTTDSFPRYVNVVAGQYSELQAIVDQWGVPRFWARAPGFETLFLIILQQQISLPVARVIHRRIKDSLGGVSARRVLEAGQERLHALGLTKQKSRYCCELAAAVKKKRFSIEGLQKLDDSAAILLLRAQLGIGPWSSAIYLMSALKRLDVWPPGDLALRRGVEKLFPGEDVKDLSDTGAQWAPYRAIAARLIWHFYNCTFSSKRQKA